MMQTAFAFSASDITGLLLRVTSFVTNVSELVLSDNSAILETVSMSHIVQDIIP